MRRPTGSSDAALASSQPKLTYWCEGTVVKIESQLESEGLLAVVLVRPAGDADHLRRGEETGLASAGRRAGVGPGHDAHGRQGQDRLRRGPERDETVVFKQDDARRAGEALDAGNDRGADGLGELAFLAAELVREVEHPVDKVGLAGHIHQARRRLAGGSLMPCAARRAGGVSEFRAERGDHAATRWGVARPRLEVSRKKKPRGARRRTVFWRRARLSWKLLMPAASIP